MLNLASAQTNSQTWHTTIKVVDEAGQPVVGATAEMDWNVNAPDNTLTFDKTEGVTDANGVFTASHEANGSTDLGFSASKEGYYTTRASHELAQLNDGDPAKWNHNVTLLLKKIGKPIAMYAKFNTPGLKVPEYGKPIAYDLQVGDWVGPYGKGINKDVFFEKEYSDKGADGYYSKVTVSFPKDGDGIQVYTMPSAEIGSSLRSPHEAPLNGYEPKATREINGLRGQPSKFEYDANRIYLFRVRTVLDQHGNVVSGHYGKIYGDFMQFTYYLNPTPNDRNIEFDPKQNLLGGLQSFEGVRFP
jgi:hypothetical protein